VADETKTKEPTAEEVQKAMEASAGNQEVVLKTESGEVFKGKDWEDVARKAAQAKVDTGTALRDREGQVRTHESTIADLQRATEARRETTQASTSPQFNQQKFLTDVETDASEAITSALAHSLGYENTDELRQDFKGIQEATESYKENYHIAVFTQRCPDYPGGDKASAAMLQIIKDRGQGCTADNYESAWNQMKRSGDFKPLEISQQETTTTARATAPVHLEGTRGGGGGGLSEADEMMANFDKMTVEEQEAFMKSDKYKELVERNQQQ
jgi:hypothetical protein